MLGIADLNLNKHHESPRASQASESPTMLALRASDDRVRHHLLILVTLASFLLLVTLIHQAFVLFSPPVDPWHYWTHYGLVLIPAFLLVSIGIVWSSYRGLSNHQQNLRLAYQALEQRIDERSKSLAESQSMWRSLFNAFKERVVVVDTNDQIVKANNFTMEQIGYNPCGRSYSDVFTPCNPPAERRSELRLIHRTFQEKIPQRGRLLSGGNQCASILSVDTYPVFCAAGTPEMVIEIARDVTKQMEIEMRLRHQEKMAALGTLAAGFSHDLGNPLASLSSELQLLRNEKNTDRIHDSLGTLETHVERISRTLRDILNFSRKRSNRAVNIDLRQASNDALRLIAHDPRAKGITTHQDFQEMLPPVLMNEDDLVLILVNLLFNAFDAMPHGGDLSISGDVADSGYIRLRINDTGIGMDEKLLGNVVKPLYTTKEANAGTGLGLPLCIDIVHSVGGQLKVESEPEHGTVITLLFPNITHTKEGPDND